MNKEERNIRFKRLINNIIGSVKQFRFLLFVLLMFLLITPLIQSKTNIIKLNPLKGAIVEPENAKFSFKDWFAGDYQPKKEEYLNSAFGFRSFFVRINNQIAFNLFNQAKANGVIIGKKNYLYEENYIKAYYGNDFIGRDSIENRFRKLKFITDTLSKLDKNLITIFAAGKGSFYPEYFPEKYKTEKGETNLEWHVRLAEEYGLNYIDFNSYFLENKNTSKYPLYPEHGIHWSNYGTCLVADSIIHYIERIRNINMPELEWDNVRMDKASGVDYDIADGMNLLFRLNGQKLAYPEIYWKSDSTNVKPSVLVISDSFYWEMFNFGISNAFSKSHFWFYNKQIYPDSYEKPITTDDVDLMKEIENHDVIIILGTEATMPGYGWGFIENCFSLFQK
jgi:hypothetical protein